MFVRENCGYNVVSESGLWDFGAKDYGLLDLNVKLVYVKYLVAFERLLDLESIDQSDDSDQNTESNCSGCLIELPEYLLESKKKVMEYSQVEESKCVKAKESINFDLKRSVFCYEEVENLRNDNDSESDKKFIYVDDYEDTSSDMLKSAINMTSNDVEDCVECKQCIEYSDDDDVMILDPNEIKEKISTRKRRRDSSWEMLNWVTEVAKDPCDLVVGSLPEMSKWKAYGSEELWKQVLLFREASFRKKDDQSSVDQSNLKKNQKMHPSMYDDNGNLGYNLRERLSCTRKGVNNSDLESSKIGIDKQLRGTWNSATPGSVFDYDVDIQVPIGPLFQVEVPEWTGVVSETDAKWLGTRVWPLEKTENRSFIELDRIGKGRPDSCGCHIQDSIECVKFHVREKRLKVKLELCSAFNKWKFDKMGEEVAFVWAQEEQKKFSSIVKSNPSSLEKCFWDEIYKHFSKKSREELVCYYYNVFLLQRRAQQNRLTPCNTNSDDDEPEAESVAKGSGREPIKSCTSFLVSPKKSHKRTRYSS